MKMDCEYFSKLAYALGKLEAAKVELRFAISYAKIAESTGDSKYEKKSRFFIGSARNTITHLAYDDKTPED